MTGTTGRPNPFRKPHAEFGAWADAGVPASETKAPLSAPGLTGVTGATSSPSPAPLRPPAWVGLAWGLFGLTMIAIAASAFTGQTDFLPALLIAPLLLGLTSPIARSFARRDEDPMVARLVMAALALHEFGALLRYEVLQHLYGGLGDSGDYHQFGVQLAPGYRHLDFSAPVPGSVGSGFLKRVTGVVYAMFGTTRFGGFLVFTWFSFLGLIFLWRAFKRGAQNGNPRAYFAAVMLLPSLFYWPSATGKEAWMLLGIGMASYGVSRITSSGRFVGIVWLVIGLSAMLAVRPHVALVIINGLMLSLLARRPGEKSPLTLGGTIVVVVIVMGIGMIVVQRAQSFLGVASLTQESVDSRINSTQNKTSEAGSSFSPVTVHTPLDLPLATLTVVFRPLPFDAGGIATSIASLEGVVLLVYTIRRRKSVTSLWRQSWRSPYVAYCLGYTLTFIVAFSSFSNFGILARQRVQVLPMYLALICVEPAYSKRKEARLREQGALTREHAR